VGAVGDGITTVGAEGAALLPIALFNFYFYSDSIGDKPVQTLDTKKAQRSKNQDEQQLSISDGTAHQKKYPFIEEFSEFLSNVPVQSLKYKLLTYQQRLMAEAIWAAENFGGDQNKCIKWLEEIHGRNWRQITKISDHMADVREYYEYVLIPDHQRQWENAKNSIT